jgi:hypothetical protein
MPALAILARSMAQCKRVPMFLILFILSITSVATTNAIASKVDRFVPQDNYLLSCGASVGIVSVNPDGHQDRR